MSRRAVCASCLADYAGVWFGDEVAHRRGVPVVAASHAAPIVQSLLYHGPLAVRCHNKAMEVDLKSVGDRIVVDARGKPAGADQGFAIEAATLGERSQFLRRVARESAASAADVDAELISSRREAAL